MPADAEESCRTRRCPAEAGRGGGIVAGRAGAPPKRGTGHYSCDVAQRLAVRFLAGAFLAGAFLAPAFFATGVTVASSAC